MIDRARRAWDWFVVGLAEAVVWFVGRLAPTPVHRLVVGDGEARLEARDGIALGRIVDVDGVAAIEPQGLAKRLKGSAIDILVPPAWLFRRSLEPVAIQSVPFLDAFVRHHIERITPWRAVDVHYRVQHSALAADATRVAVDVCVVPRRLLATWVSAVEGVKPQQVRILSQAAADRSSAIVIGADGSKVGDAARQRVGLALALLGLALVGTLAWLWWEAGTVRDDIAEQDRVLEERKAVLARAHRQDQGGQDIDAKLLAMRKARTRVVDVVETLAQALPDSAHLTGLTLQKSQMTIAGVSTDTSLIVPALEKSGRFADVAFGAATTKVESGQGDRFQLDMRVRDPAPNAP